MLEAGLLSYLRVGMSRQRWCALDPVWFSLHHVRLGSDEGRTVCLQTKTEGKEMGTFKTEESAGRVLIHEGSDTSTSFPSPWKGSVDTPSNLAFFLSMAPVSCHCFLTFLSLVGLNPWAPGCVLALTWPSSGGLQWKLRHDKKMLKALLKMKDDKKMLKALIDCIKIMLH